MTDNQLIGAEIQVEIEDIEGSKTPEIVETITKDTVDIVAAEGLQVIDTESIKNTLDDLGLEKIGIDDVTISLSDPPGERAAVDRRNQAPLIVDERRT